MDRFSAHSSELALINGKQQQTATIRFVVLGAHSITRVRDSRLLLNLSFSSTNTNNVSVGRCRCRCRSRCAVVHH